MRSALKFSWKWGPFTFKIKKVITKDLKINEMWILSGKVWTVRCSFDVCFSIKSKKI